jgi:hypothetical protein
MNEFNNDHDLDNASDQQGHGHRRPSRGRGKQRRKKEEAARGFAQTFVRHWQECGWLGRATLITSGVFILGFIACVLFLGPAVAISTPALAGLNRFFLGALSQGAQVMVWGYVLSLFGHAVAATSNYGLKQQRVIPTRKTRTTNETEEIIPAHEYIKYLEPQYTPNDEQQQPTQPLVAQPSS